MSLNYITIFCTDYSRNIFYKDINGNINKDINYKKLVNLIEPLASAKQKKLIEEDYIVKTKAYKLKILREKIYINYKEIEDLNEHLLGIEKDTKRWRNILEIINIKENNIKKNKNEMEELLNEGIEEIKDIEYDKQLINAAEDIKYMQKDSTKFSKALANILI